MADEQFESTDAGGSEFVPQRANTIKKNQHCMIKGNPCKVVDVSSSKTGKHGHAKINMTGVDIFTGNKYEMMCPGHDNIEVPNVTRTEYQLIDISDDGFLSVLLDDGGTKDDLPLPDGDLGAEIREAFDNGQDIMVAAIAAVGKEAVVAKKDLKE